MSAGLRIGCDVGGSFTDFLLFDPATGAVETLKVPTTPEAPEQGVMAGLAELAAARPGLLEGMETLIHGTTLVINAIIERKGAETALITNAGFRDVLETRREIRYDIYDIRQAFPAPIVPRRLRREVAGRIGHDGQEFEPLDADGLRDVLRDLAGQGVASVALCLLHSYANPAQERQAAAIAAEMDLPLDLSLSSDVLPEVQEFERFSTTALNAYVRPKVDRYLGALEGALADAGYAHPLFLMQSGGGVIGAQTARQAPVRLAESGPVGGVLAAGRLGQAAGADDILAFDMGGTTAKACLIRDGELPITRAYEVDRVHRFKRGSGTPLAVPTVDLIEIGAGGGSIAQVDALGLLRIGPESAASDPGPACFGRGGTRATITDANLVLGYLDPAEFRAGGIILDVEAARAAIARDVAALLGLDVDLAAAAIVAMVDENMAQAARMYAAEHGGDPARAAMVACGGGGPLHGAAVARKLGITRLMVPEAAGVFSALGFLMATPSFEVARSRPARLDALTPGALEDEFAALAAEADAVVGAVAPRAPLTRRRYAEMRYAGQGHQLRVRLQDDLSAPAIAAAFAAAYDAAYGYTYDDLVPEIVTLRLVSEAAQEGPGFAAATAGPAPAPRWRRAWDPLAGQMVDHQVLPFDAVTGEVTGPALIGQSGTTILLPAGARARKGPGGWLDITLPDPAEAEATAPAAATQTRSASRPDPRKEPAT
ncbi:hydantoinase/oxoprolinase family protein [Pseudooceanicola aestuarii]|uniref:hydantoinase/oxoprolinase family protein n=1 Tax=Pseudooceanicola aestuarii TaxID=2697319 RepID=UPI0013D4B2AC|nr:hydantoinase/oxoprolinase family protein [Pseudooceanicola aestuarii]